MKRIILAAALLLSVTANSQLVEGSYYTSNGKYTVKAYVCEAGYSICEFTLTMGDSLLVSGKGEWFQVNLNGVGDEYNGPGGWYAIKLDDINIEVDIENDNMMYFYNPYDESQGKITLKLIQ